MKPSASPPTRSRARRTPRTVHYVPKKPDNVDEQKAMVEQVLKDRPDVVIFIPVDDVAMIDSVKKLNEAKIPVVLASNPLPGSFVTFVGADDFEIGYRAGALSVRAPRRQGPRSPSSRARRRHPPTANGCAATGGRWPNFRIELWSGIGNYQQPDARRVMAKFLTDIRD